MNAAAVRAAMDQTVAHPREDGRIHRPTVEVEQGGDATHG
jgi:hypothetical protein